MIHYIRLDSVPSTNSYMSALPPDTPAGTVVTAAEQSAGRGQRGNSWEAAPGQNLTLSVLLRPASVTAREQFMVSEAVALAVVHTVRHYLSDSYPVTVKWPNDIYVRDLKICGILIENTLTGSGIDRSIAGIGLNVNQERFISDAPNPTSIYMLTGRKVPLAEIEDRLCRNVVAMAHDYLRPERFAELHDMYVSALWRGSGMHPYIDAATSERFMASIHSIAPTGHITLRQDSGTLRTYAFKEVHPLL
ncbi:MAG: biotin--[acetyl-CoA-carboxylase] ligase [Muribaculaceae bacterium]|nr:biotin--[acetyl-CoA-carboxylase] ligase [Muribaculaceae bacterium]